MILVKSTIWAVSLGSGTSGGVLAPLLMMGGALGGTGGARFARPRTRLLADCRYGGNPRGNDARRPLTGIVFTLELTHDINLMLPLLCRRLSPTDSPVCVMRRSILTEKIDRRGFHVSREYAVDPLEVLFVRDVMRTEVVALPASLLLEDVFEPQTMRIEGGFSQGLYPVVDEDKRLVGS